MFGKKTAAIALSLLLLLPAAALAADEAAETQGNVQELERVEVTGSRLAEELGDVPAPAYVVTSADIAKSGARNVQEILNRVPGVIGLYGSSTMAFDKGVSVRGVNSEVLLLVDGMPFMGASYGVGASMGSPFDLRTLPLADIDRIEVVKGASSAIYGSNAAGGVINVITRKGADKSSASIKVEGGNLGFFRGTVRGTAVASDDMRVTLGYTRTLENGDVKYQKNIDGSYYYTRDYKGNDYDLRVEKGPWSFVGEFGDYSSEWDFANYDEHYVPYTDTARQDNRYRRFSLNYRDDSTTGRVYYNVNERKVDQYGGTTEYNDYTTGVIFNHRQDWGKVPVVWGLDWRRENAEYKASFNPYDLTRNGFAPYIEATLPVGEANIDLGLRYEHWNVDHDDDVNELIPRISVNWESQAGLLWYATAGRFFSMPSFYQIFNPYSLSNENLNPEKGWTYDIGVKAEKARNPWKLGLFYMDMTDKIKYKTLEYVYYTGQYVNVDKYRAWGIEGQIKFNLNDNWSYTQGLSWTKSEQQEEGADSWTRTDDPRWDLSGFLDYTNGPWTAEIAMHYYADRELTAAAYDDDNIFMVNASLGWKQGRHTLKASVSNIFDKEYVVSNSGYLTPERRFILSWEYEF